MYFIALLKEGKTYKKPENPGVKLFSAIATYGVRPWGRCLRKKKVRKKLMQTYISTHLFRAVGIRGRGALSPPDFDRQDKPIILRGQIMHDYAHYIISYPMPNPGISNLPTALFFLHNCYHSSLTYKGKHNTAGTIKRMRICVSLWRFFRIWLAMLMICNN